LRLSPAVSLSPVDELELDEDDEDAVLVAQLLGEEVDWGTTIAFAVEEVDWGTSCDLA
jgi:hypothetical protein